MGFCSRSNVKVETEEPFRQNATCFRDPKNFENQKKGRDEKVCMRSIIDERWLSVSTTWKPQSGWCWPLENLRWLMTEVFKVNVEQTEVFNWSTSTTLVIINVDCRQLTSTPLHFSWSTLTRLSFSSCRRRPDWAFHGWRWPEWTFLVVDGRPRTSTVDVHFYWCVHRAQKRNFENKSIKDTFLLRSKLWLCYSFW